ncbi:MAG: efflux transporter outer membrane subunit [Desulfobulbus sp.]|jgi:NodT family efflux transporter outer membrane factor (OMF) lipoprotein|uniref:efflux transporter outer membrane subunit n=1 Tax=Desulfobulbus sp. TaxID=895 RepID=UPI002848932D|nr:efflux transporter outer membrane subunit [Desulfobulbus sp.]MDR2549232.1 efflux transporter outer membrane subunit [Desulfobulbus sp.]
MLQKNLGLKTTCLVLLCLLPAGCTVGPDFKPLEPAGASRFTEERQPEAIAGIPADEDRGVAGNAQVLVPGPPHTQWWEQLGNEKMSGLVERALSHSPDLARIRAVLRQAEETWRVEAGEVWFPALDLTASATPQQLNMAQMGSSGSLPASMPYAPSPFTQYTAGVNLRYTLDILGQGRRQLEALAAQVDRQQYALEAARLSLAGTVAVAAVRDAETRASIATVRTMLDIRRQQVAIAQAKNKAGGASTYAVSTAKNDLADLAATLPPLEQTLSANRHQLAILLGSPPSEAHLPEFSLEDFTLPTRLPLALPGEVVRGRPDVREAEALVHQATAEVGVAVADLYPGITLVGSAGYSVSRPIDDKPALFLDHAGVWSVGISLFQPLFQGGALQARKRMKEAGAEEAHAAWQQVVLRAYADVADCLGALGTGARTLVATADAAHEARTRYLLAQHQYDLGAINLADLLEADLKWRQAMLAETEARANRFVQTLALLQATAAAPERDRERLSLARYREGK